MKEVKEYIEQRGWKYKSVPSRKGIQLQIDHCPFCSSTDPTHFYIAEETGQYLCFKCGAKGGLLSLKEHCGDLAAVEGLFKPLVEEFPVITLEEVQAAHAALDDSKVALRYLKERRFSGAAVEHFMIGYSEELGNQWVWYPYMTHGKPVNVKKRSLEGKKFYRITGGESILLNQDVLETNLDEVVLTEGEGDCVALWSAGVHNVVGNTLGAQSISPTWVDLLDKVPKIYVAYDMDDAGQDGAYKLAGRLGLEKCFQIILPAGIKDVNEFFQKGYSPDQFRILMDQAKPFRPQYVTSVGDEIQNVIRKLLQPDEEKEASLKVPWAKVDKLLNGFEAGDLIIVAGQPGVGKSTFAINLAYLFSRDKFPVLLFEMEMRPYRIIPGLAGLHFGMDRRTTMQVEIMQSFFKQLREFPLYFAYAYKKPNFEFCSDTIRKCYNKYGLRFIVFDNLHFLCRDAKNQTGEVSAVVQGFKLLAEELSIPIMLVARPRKMFGNKKIMSNQDLKDSADIEGDADSIILLHRDRKSDVQEGTPIEEGIFAPELLVRVSKARWGPGGDTHMIMDDERCQVLEGL